MALLPAALYGCVRYGAAGIQVILAATSSAVIFEWAARKVMKRDPSISDYSALLQGTILGMILPPGTPVWLVIIATFLMIVIGKQFFGGIGGYPFNPPAIAAAMLMVSYPKRMISHFPLHGTDPSSPFLEPLAALKSYGPGVTEIYSLNDLFMGIHNSGTGTGAVFLLLLGGIYAMIRGFIPWRAPVSFITGTFLTAWLFHASQPETYAPPLFHILAGMTVFAAFFLITDSTTCPVNPLAATLYGLFAGILLVLIRNLGMYYDGAVFAVLILNLFHPLLDRIHKPVIGLNTEAVRLPEQA